MSRHVVSVIVPAYNVREYIEKAVDSICNQSLTDWEMFLIDDRSDDGTADICHSLAFSVSRISIKDNTERPAWILCFKFGNEVITNLMFFRQSDAKTRSPSAPLPPRGNG